MSDYPNEQELKLIREWPYTDFKGLIEFLQDVFWYPEWCISVKGKQVLRVWISTGGWSGNEDRIDALQQNSTFWFACWQWSKRGGHYFFKINLKQLNK